MNNLTFEILGTPVAKGRARIANRGKFASMYTPKTVDAERSLLAQALPFKLPDMPWSEALAVDILAVFPIPASYSKKRRQDIIDGIEHHVKKPDADNIAKTVLDSLNQVFFIDDCLITELTVKKMYGDIPKTIITIREINEVEK